MILPDKVYNFLKWFLITAVAPIVALIEGLGALYNFNTRLIVGTISLVTTFLGAFVGISNVKYCKNCEDDNHNEVKDHEIIE